MRLIITMGDPSGIGPEVLLRTLSRPPSSASISILGDLRWLQTVSRRLRLSIPWRRYRWLDLGGVPLRFQPGRLRPATGRAAYSYLQEAVRLLQRGDADALVTGPVSKEGIVRAGVPWVGHTEFLAERFRRPTVMMFVTGRFRASLVTTHLSLRDLPRCLTRQKVLQTIRLTRDSLIRDFGIRRPRIGLASLNPHAGEGGLFGTEERRILIPAVQRLRPAVEGPLPADTLMREAARGAYEAVVALYHDQALIPIKLLGWESAVNVTLGLPFVRTSPVHGTAFDLARKGWRAGRSLADPHSMQAAIQLAIRLARKRQKGSDAF